MPKIRSKLVENGCRKMKCPGCEFEADRDTVTVLLNIGGKHLEGCGGLWPPERPQMTDVNLSK
jgi:transposase